jgi:diguanylate cyclase (GGDEF)-like protein
LIALSATFLLTLAIADTMLIFYLKEDNLADGRRETSNLAYVLAEQTDRGLQAANLIASDVVGSFSSLGLTDSSSFEAASSGTRIETYLREKTSGIPQIANVAIIGAGGKLIKTMRLGESASFDFSQRDYFIALSHQPNLPYYISSPFQSRTTGSWNIALARSVTSQHGDLLGVVAVVIELKTLEELYSRIKLGRNGSISLFRADGVLLTRYPRIESLFGTSNASSPLFTEYVFKGANGVLRQTSRLDGVDRIIAGNRAPSFPVVAVVSASVDDLLADWRGQTEALIVAGLIAAAAILSSALMLARRTEELSSATSKLAAAHEREIANAAIEAEHNRFIAAISNMGQGLVMFDADEKLIVCNHRYAEMYKLPEDLTAPGTPRTDILKCRERMATDRDGQSRFRDNALMEVNREHAIRDGRVIAVVHRPMLDGGWVSTHEDVTQRRQVESKVAHMAEHDPLTDLPNRLHFRRKLEECLREVRQGRRFALLYVDLDHFKNVNDNMGHPTGDALLQLVAQRLGSVIRPTDTLARVGGDEFIVIQKVERDGDAAALASRLIAKVSAPYEVSGGHVVIGATVGISHAPENGVQPDELIRHADLALYQAKATERGSFQLFSPEMEASLAARRDLERELRQALLRNEFELYYQPLVCLSDLTITAFEALLRWNHPERGVLAPGEFIAAAEETSLILPIGEWAVRQACLQAAQWPQDVKVAVNVSAVQLRSSSFVPAVAAALRDSGVHASRLEVEVTETVMLHEADNSVMVLHQLRSMGIKVVMDDFGTGYSSLSYLRLFPFDKLKIDQSFVRGLGSSNECEAIVSAAVRLAVKLGMTTVAEGIETKGQLLRATREGCTEGQGYLFGRPAPAERLEFGPMLNTDSART